MMKITIYDIPICIINNIVNYIDSLKYQWIFLKSCKYFYNNLYINNKYGQSFQDKFISLKIQNMNKILLNISNYDYEEVTCGANDDNCITNHFRTILYGMRIMRASDFGDDYECNVCKRSSADKMDGICNSCKQSCKICEKSYVSKRFTCRSCNDRICDDCVNTYNDNDIIYKYKCNNKCACCYYSSLYQDTLNMCVDCGILRFECKSCNIIKCPGCYSIKYDMCHACVSGIKRKLKRKYRKQQNRKLNGQLRCNYKHNGSVDYWIQKYINLY